MITTPTVSGKPGQAPVEEVGVVGGVAHNSRRRFHQRTTTALAKHDQEMPHAPEPNARKENVLVGGGSGRRPE